MNKLTVKVKGKDRTVNVGLRFFGELPDLLNMSFEDILASYDRNVLKYAPLIMWHSMNLVEELEFTNAEFIDWLDENGGASNSELQKFCKFFLYSLNGNVPKDEDIKEVKGDSKKK